MLHLYGAVGEWSVLFEEFTAKTNDSDSGTFTPYGFFLTPPPPHYQRGTSKRKRKE
jgi:hypothetical protein